jgi:chaperone required for assembly of F1-ATPase
MKKFYKQASVQPAAEGFAIELDGRPVRTPGKAILALASRALADAIAAEWQGQEDTIQPESMPLTRLANSALDVVAANRVQVVETIAGYGGSDLLCYWADGPADLVERQAEIWQPLLDWAAGELGARLQTTSGIGFVEQPQEALTALRRAVDMHDDMELAALHDLTTICGSLVVGLAGLREYLGLEETWRAGNLDADYQSDRWGQDSEAAARERRLRGELASAFEFVRLHRAG